MLLWAFLVTELSRRREEAKLTSEPPGNSCPESDDEVNTLEELLRDLCRGTGSMNYISERFDPWDGDYKRFMRKIKDYVNDLRNVADKLKQASSMAVDPRPRHAGVRVSSLPGPGRVGSSSNIWILPTPGNDAPEPPPDAIRSPIYLHALTDAISLAERVAACGDMHTTFIRRFCENKEAIRIRIGTSFDSMSVFVNRRVQGVVGMAWHLAKTGRQGSDTITVRDKKIQHVGADVFVCLSAIALAEMDCTGKCTWTQHGLQVFYRERQVACPNGDELSLLLDAVCGPTDAKVGVKEFIVKLANMTLGRYRFHYNGYFDGGQKSPPMFSLLQSWVFGGTKCYMGAFGEWLNRNGRDQPDIRHCQYEKLSERPGGEWQGDSKLVSHARVEEAGQWMLMCVIPAFSDVMGFVMTDKRFPMSTSLTNPANLLWIFWLVHPFAASCPRFLIRHYLGVEGDVVTSADLLRISPMLPGHEQAEGVVIYASIERLLGVIYSFSSGTTTPYDFCTTLRDMLDDFKCVPECLWDVDEEYAEAIVDGIRRVARRGARAALEGLNRTWDKDQLNALNAIKEWSCFELDEHTWLNMNLRNIAPLAGAICTLAYAIAGGMPESFPVFQRHGYVGFLDMCRSFMSRYRGGEHILSSSRFEFSGLAGLTLEVVSVSLGSLHMAIKIMCVLGGFSDVVVSQHLNTPAVKSVVEFLLRDEGVVDVCNALYDLFVDSNAQCPEYVQTLLGLLRLPSGRGPLSEDVLVDAKSRLCLLKRACCGLTIFWPLPWNVPEPDSKPLLEWAKDTVVKVWKLAPVLDRIHRIRSRFYCPGIKFAEVEELFKNAKQDHRLANREVVRAYRTVVDPLSVLFFADGSSAL